MIDLHRPDPNQYPPEACMRFTVPASSVRTLPSGKVVVLVPLLAATPFVRALIQNLQQMGMWPADPPAPPVPWFYCRACYSDRAQDKASVIHNPGCPGPDWREAIPPMPMLTPDEIAKAFPKGNDGEGMTLGPA